MLRLTAATIATAAIAVTVAIAVAAPADARGEPSPPITCSDQGACEITVSAPGRAGSPGSPAAAQPAGNAGPEQCAFPPGSGDVVPCFDSTLGWFNPSNGCYYRNLPAPTENSPNAAGAYHPPGDGAYYLQSCSGIVGPRPGALGLVQGAVWLAEPPLGFGGAGPDPAVLAQRAVALLGLAGPDIRLSPPATSEQVVGLPTWMWTAVGPATWTTHSATAAVTGESVTATATATSIDWSMGDGHSVTCNSPGTPYSSSYGAHAASPTCGYTYSSPSSTADGNPVTGTTTWQVTWAGGGQIGALTVRRSSTVRVVVMEAEAVNQ